MGSDRLRVLVLALASIAMLVLSALVLDWFRMSLPNVAIDLREARFCDADGTCQSFHTGGSYGFFAAVSLWSSLIFAGLVAYLGGTRALGGTLNERFVRIGYLVGVAVFLAAFATGYLFNPELSIKIAGIIEISFERSLAPSLMLLGALFGIAALYYGLNPGSSAEGTYVPVVVEQRKPDPDSGLRLRVSAEGVAKSRTTTPDRSRITGQVEPITKARLVLARASQIVLRNGLSLLGIGAPDRM